jgi:hypothetical protein
MAISRCRARMARNIRSNTDIIKEDPQGIFSKTYTCNNRRANFQYIALKKNEGYAWREIAEDLNLKISAISNFYRRCLQEFAPLIQKYLSE